MGRYERYKKSLMLLLAAGMALRALVPVGYMPGSKDGGLLPQLCPDQLPRSFLTALRDDHSAHHHHHETDAESSDTCDTGHLFAGVFLEPAAVEFAVAGFLAEALPLPNRQAHRFALKTTYLARGPPLLP